MKKRTLSRILSLALAAMCLLPVLAQAEEYATVQGGGLNLRQSASLEAKVLGQYGTGTWIEVVKKGETWSQVKVNGKAGYMMTKYLNFAQNGKTLYVRTNTGILWRGHFIPVPPSRDGHGRCVFRSCRSVQLCPIRVEGRHVHGRERSCTLPFWEKCNCRMQPVHIVANSCLVFLSRFPGGFRGTRQPWRDLNYLLESWHDDFSKIGVNTNAKAIVRNKYKRRITKGLCASHASVNFTLQNDFGRGFSLQL